MERTFGIFKMYLDKCKKICWNRTLETLEKRDFKFVCGFSSKVTAIVSFGLLTALLIPLASLYQMTVAVRDCVSGIYTVECMRVPYSFKCMYRHFIF